MLFYLPKPAFALVFLYVHTLCYHIAFVAVKKATHGLRNMPSVENGKGTSI